jgi:hypothetical protein
MTVALGSADELRGAGLPDPIVGDSGNGGHLIYLLDCANDPTTTELFQRVLKGVAARCGTEDVAVDLTVFNPARISKLYGTWARKGDNLPERPHRRSRLLEVPSRPEPIAALDPFVTIAGWAPEQPSPNGRTRAAWTGGFDLEAFIAAHLEVRRGPLAWAGRGTKWELEVCPFNSDHTGGCAVITRGTDGAIGFKCHHNSCVDKGWRDVRALFDEASPEPAPGGHRTAAAEQLDAGAAPDADDWPKPEASK